MKTRKLFL